MGHQAAGTAPAASAGPVAPGQARRGMPRKGSRKTRWVLVGLAAAGLTAYLFSLPGGPAGFISSLTWGEVLRPLVRILLYVGLGLIFGQLLEGLGLNARIGALTAPVMRRANLPPEAGTAFAAAFASGVTANTLLYTSWQEGRLTRGQLVTANLMNASLPAYFLHLPTTFFVVTGLLGTPALIYFAITLAAALLRFFGAALAGRLFLPPTSWEGDAVAPAKKPWARVWRETRDKFLLRFRRMLVVILPVYLAVFLLSKAGAFEDLGRWLSTWISTSLLPVEAMSIVVFSVAAEATSGFAAAAALLESRALAVQTVVVALLIGNMVATPVRVLRHQLPYYLGIYSPLLGGALVALSQVVRVLSLGLITLLYVFF